MGENVIQCRCPECGGIVEYSSRTDNTGKIYKPGDQITFSIIHNLKSREEDCSCGCYCQLEFVQCMTYIALIR